MKTRLINITSVIKDYKKVQTAADILKKGGIVAIPTETVYGLAANAFDQNAILKIFKAKGRPQDNPLIVHISDFEMLQEIVSEIPEKALELATAFWPGPLTIVFKKSKNVPAAVSAGLDTVAVRMPSNTVARTIIGACDFPLAAPSANLSGSPSPTSAEHVIADLDGKINAVVVSENAEVGLESTVVSIVGEHPKLLRPGAVTPEQLREILPDLEIDQAVLEKLEEGKTAASPGMKYKHYSPKTNVIMVKGDSKKFADYVNQNAQADTFALCFDEDKADLRVPTISYGSEKSQGEQASLLFSALRELDRQGAKIAFAHAPNPDGIGLAVYNRLIRAAAFEVVEL